MEEVEEEDDEGRRRRQTSDAGEKRNLKLVKKKRMSFL
jgi:hypothetical protein